MNQSIIDERIEPRVRHMQKLIVERDKQALEAMLQSNLGRWFLMRLFDRCALNTDSFTGQLASTSRLEGMRYVALQYQKDIAELGMDGIRQKHIAELEYIEFQEQISKYIEQLIQEQGEDI